MNLCNDRFMNVKGSPQHLLGAFQLPGVIGEVADPGAMRARSNVSSSGRTPDYEPEKVPKQLALPTGFRGQGLRELLGPSN